MIEWLFKRLEPLIRWIVRFPFRVLLISVVTALAGFLLAVNLKIDNDLSKLIPRDYPSVQALNTLREQVGSENELAVAIESPSFEANKAFAEDLIPRALNMVNAKTSEPWFSRAEFKKDISFIEQNALYFATGRELDLLQDYLTDRIEQAKMEANPFYFELDEEEDELETDSLGEELEQMYDELIGSEYPVSEDSTAMAVRFYPTGSQTDLDFIREVYSALQREVDALNPASYHPEMQVTLAGRLLRTLIEIETITEDVKDSFGAGVLMLLAVVVLYFFYKSYRITAGLHFNRKVLGQEIIRIPFIAVTMGFPLALSLCWTFGIAYLAFSNLNIMTSTLGLLLFGMGIDFGIHFFARYSEERGKGSSIEEAAVTTFMTTGQAVTVVGITTSAAFFVLTLADFKGFSEFGFIAGIGILFAIIAYVLFLPALLAMQERKNLLNLDRFSLEAVPLSREVENEMPVKSAQKSMAITILLLGIGLTAFSVYHIPQLSFEYRFSNLEPEYERYTSLNSHVRKVYSDRRTRNAAYIITDTPEDAVAAASVLRHRAVTDTLNPTIDRVETFQDRYPMTDSSTILKLNRINDIRELLNDPFLSGQGDDQLERLRRAASTREKIPLPQVPDFIKSPFTSKSGEVGNMAIIYPSVGLADGRNSMNFSDDVSKISLENGKTYYAGSTSIVASDMLRLMIDEAPKMVLLTVTVIVVFKLLILRRIRWMLLALVPLVASFVWMFGLMEAFGWKLNFYNLVVLPTVLGIGDDSGIHMVHRYLEEGRGSVHKVLRSTGEHITVSSLTTTVGFGGLLFSIHPGMASIGELAILGILLTLGAALFLVPAIINLWEIFQDRRPKNRDKSKKSVEPARK